KLASAGEKAYKIYCSTCHQGDGEGDGGRFPPLNESEWVVGDKTRLIDLVLNGMEGPITVKGESFNSTMPKHDFMSDAEIAHVLNYIKNNFNDKSSAVNENEVAQIRKNTANNLLKQK